MFTVILPDITDMATFRCCFMMMYDPNKISISREIMTIRNHIGILSTHTANRNSKIAHTLSARGSSILPSSDRWLSNLARYPSRKSLSIAQATSIVNRVSGRPSGGPNIANGMGTSILDIETMFDIVKKSFLTSTTFPSILSDTSANRFNLDCQHTLKDTQKVRCVHPHHPI